jgi:hypothetical protein
MIRRSFEASAVDHLRFKFSQKKSADFDGTFCTIQKEVVGMDEATLIEQCPVHSILEWGLVQGTEINRKDRRQAHKC